MSTAKSLFIRRESGVWGSLRSQKAALAEANERLAQLSTEVADLRLLRDELKSEAAAARAEAVSARTELQQWQRDQSRSQAAEAVGRAEALRGQLAEATERLAEASAQAETLTEDLAVAVGSAQSAQAVVSQQRARAEGTFRPLCDFDSASFFNSCLKNFVWLSAEFETALNESVKALAQAAEQKEADRVAMSETISDFCRAFGLDDVPSGSSTQSHLWALGGHVRSRLREALHHGVRRAFVVLASHYDVDLERVSEGYCLPDEDEAALAEVRRLDAAVAGPSAVLAPPLRWRSFRSRRRLGPGQILPRVEKTPRVALPMSDPTRTVCLEYAYVFRGR
jgi:multidrug efflux pump subunit AcrA (membrane-fusion protein)